MFIQLQFFNPDANWDLFSNYYSKIYDSTLRR